MAKAREKQGRRQGSGSVVTGPKEGHPAGNSGSIEGRGDLEQGLARVRSLLEQADLNTARACLARLKEEWPDSERVARLSRLLTASPVRLETGKSERTRDAEHRWLREHAREYPGRWLALLGDRLIAAEQDLSAVLKQVRKTERPDEVLLHFEPVDQGWS
jgi:hypothetical protein